MGKYRYKLPTIEAIQLRWDNWSMMCDFIDVGEFMEGHPEGYMRRDGKMGLKIPENRVFDDVRLAKEGDWIIKRSLDLQISLTTTSNDLNDLDVMNNVEFTEKYEFVK